MRRGQPDLRRIKRKQSYTVSEVATNLGVTIGTVRRWITSGLPVIDERRPKLVHGSDLREWLVERRENRRVKCGPRQMYCFKCRDARDLLPGSPIITNRNDKSASIQALCIECGAKMFRQCSKAGAVEWLNFSGAPKRHQLSLVASNKPLLDEHLAKQGNLPFVEEGDVSSLQSPAGNQRR